MATAYTTKTSVDSTKKTCLYYQDLCRFYQEDHRMKHVRDHLIPGTPISHSRYSHLQCFFSATHIESDSHVLHTDDNTIGPTFMFILEEDNGTRNGEVVYGAFGGGLTLVEPSSDPRLLLKVTSSSSQDSRSVKSLLVTGTIRHTTIKSSLGQDEVLLCCTWTIESCRFTAEQNRTY